METQQSTADSKREALTDGARYVVAELVREPVRDAVREALDEEAVAVRPGEADTETDRPGGADRSEPDARDDDGGGRSRVGLILASVAAAAGVAYLVRKRRSDTEQSTWSEFEDEGDERARTEDGRTEHAPASTGAESARTGESTASPAAGE